MPDNQASANEPVRDPMTVEEQAQQPPPYMPDMAPVDILCGQLRPPGARSAKIRGFGQISSCGNLLQIQVRAKQYYLATLFALLLLIIITLATLPSCSLFYFPPLFLLCQFIARKNMTLQIEPTTHALYYMQHKQVACLQLPDGRWIAIRARDKNRCGELWVSLNRVYRGNVTKIW